MSHIQPQSHQLVVALTIPYDCFYSSLLETVCLLCKVQVMLRGKKKKSVFCFNLPELDFPPFSDASTFWGHH